MSSLYSVSNSENICFRVALEFLPKITENLKTKEIRYEYANGGSYK
jgi:hypothetical protein